MTSPDIAADITMQDVRLVCGEGKLENRHILNAVNVIIKRRAEMAVAARDSGVAQAPLSEALELAKNIIFGSQFAATRERDYAKAAEYQSYIDTIDSTLSALSSTTRGNAIPAAQALSAAPKAAGWEPKEEIPPQTCEDCANTGWCHYNDKCYLLWAGMGMGMGTSAG